MELKIGKTYELNNGEVHECTGMIGDDPMSVDEYGCGPFRLNGGLYHQDGTFWDGVCDALNVKRCVDDDERQDGPFIDIKTPATPMELLILSAEAGMWDVSRAVIDAMEAQADG